MTEGEGKNLFEQVALIQEHLAGGILRRTYWKRIGGKGIGGVKNRAVQGEETQMFGGEITQF